MKTLWKATGLRPLAPPAAQEAASLLQDIIFAPRRGKLQPVVQAQMEAAVKSYLEGFEGDALDGRIDQLLEALKLSVRCKGLREGSLPQQRSIIWEPLMVYLRAQLMNAERVQDATAAHLLSEKPAANLLALASPRAPAGAATQRRQPAQPSRLPAPTLQPPSALPLSDRSPTQVVVPSSPVPREAAEGPTLSFEQSQRFQNRLPSQLAEFLASVQTSEDEVRLEPHLGVPHFINRQGAPRPLLRFMTRPQQALGWIAQQVRQGRPGGLLEAEAFAFMYNLPARVWVSDEQPGHGCRRQQVLRQGDPSENYASRPLGLLLGRAGWGVCDDQGRQVEKPYHGDDGLYQALQVAARRACRGTTVTSSVPKALSQVRQDVASRLEGATSLPLVPEAERILALSWLRKMQLQHIVLVTRHDPAADTDYLAPPLGAAALPLMGVVHRGQRGWQVFVACEMRALTAKCIDGFLLRARSAEPGRLEDALNDLWRLVGRSGDPQLAILRQPAAPGESAPPTLSMHYAEQAMQRLQSEHQDYQGAIENEGWASVQRASVEASSAAYASQRTYRPFVSSAQEKIVKSYMAYLGEAKQFGAEVSAAGLSDILKRVVRIWTPQGRDLLALEPSKVHGPQGTLPMDLLRVGLHYQVLDTRRLEQLGTPNVARSGELRSAQLGAASQLPIEQALLESHVALDVGGDGNCQFLAVAYACNWRDFASLYGALRTDISAATRAAFMRRFEDEPQLGAATPAQALTYLCERTAQELRNALIAHWSHQIQAADYAQAPQVQKLIGDLEEAAHNEASEMLGKARSVDPSFSWVVGLDRQTPNTLKQRLAVLERVMKFCPPSDAPLRAQGEHLLDIFRRELSKH